MAIHRSKPMGPDIIPDEWDGAVHIVNITASDPQTGGVKHRSIIDIFREATEAQRLVIQFNGQQSFRKKRRATGVEVKAHTVRYQTPYVAPAAKRLVE